MDLPSIESHSIDFNVAKLTGDTEKRLYDHRKRDSLSFEMQLIPCRYDFSMQRYQRAAKSSDEDRQCCVSLLLTSARPSELGEVSGRRRLCSTMCHACRLGSDVALKNSELFERTYLGEKSTYKHKTNVILLDFSFRARSCRSHMLLSCDAFTCTSDTQQMRYIVVERCQYTFRYGGAKTKYFFCMEYRGNFVRRLFGHFHADISASSAISLKWYTHDFKIGYYATNVDELCAIHLF